MNTATDTVLAALRSAGFKPRKSGMGWSCRCPAHDDKKPSLSIATGDDGRALLNCHAGCETTDIVKAIGLEMRDLMPERRPAPVSNTRLHKQETGVSETGTLAGFASADEAVSALERKLGPCSRRWVYPDASGQPVGETIRWDTPNGKEVRPIACRGGRWFIAAMSEPRPLLGLTELTELPNGAWVYIVEGEKCVDAARAIGVIATTSAGGSKAAAKSDWSVIENKVAVILPDNDEAGESYAAQVAGLCRAAGADEVRIVRLADAWTSLPAGGDIADVLELERGDTESVNKRLDALAHVAKPEAGNESEGVADPVRFVPFPVGVLPDGIRQFVVEGPPGRRSCPHHDGHAAQPA